MSILTSERQKGWEQEQHQEQKGVRKAAAVGKGKSRSSRWLDWASLLHYGRGGRMGAAAAAAAGRASLLQVTALCTVVLISNKIRWQ